MAILGDAGWRVQRLDARDGVFPAMMQDAAPTRREDILHPIDVWSIGQREDEVPGARFDDDRRLVGLAALAPDVPDEGERRTGAPSDAARERIEDVDGEKLDGAEAGLAGHGRGEVYSTHRSQYR